MSSIINLTYGEENEPSSEKQKILKKNFVEFLRKGKRIDKSIIWEKKKKGELDFDNDC